MSPRSRFRSTFLITLAAAALVAFFTSAMPAEAQGFGFGFRAVGPRACFSVVPFRVFPFRRFVQPYPFVRVYAAFPHRHFLFPHAHLRSPFRRPLRRY